MSSLDGKLAELRDKEPLGYWGERIYHELAYAARLSVTKQGAYDQLVSSAYDSVLSAFKKHGTIGREDVLLAEKMMQSLSSEAKSFRMICAAHAHIDMNWMWRWDETVAVTIDTFRTMLDLMNEYPEFKFSQSQASTYQIIERYAPEMLQEIRSRVSEGRWEVTASTWVESDKNLPNGESLARQILYTKRYLSTLLGVDPDSLNIDFEPDTFGHSQNVPEILTAGGVKYYYHCRGYEEHYLYRWVAPSGAAVIVYREPIWYNAEINPDMALYVPEFCTGHQMDTMLKVYGVGDHGGGPTRRDIERINDMDSWPIFPRMSFGTFKEYFSLVDQVSNQLPEVKGELNFVFTGCYTTQTRIKKANRVAESTLYEAEMFEAAAAASSGSVYHQDAYRDAWQNVLFNQFHDIIPGSGVVDTREYAMGLFQHTMAIANTNRTMAMRHIARELGTLAPTSEESVRNDVFSTSEGAGVGFGIQNFKVFQTARGRGKTRVFQVFNAAPFAREDVAEVVLWDWPGDVRRMRCRNEDGDIVKHQLLDHGRHDYWGHSYIRVLIMATVPSCGCATYTLIEDQDADISLRFPRDLRVERSDSFVLENDLIRVAFETTTGAIVSIMDKAKGEELVQDNGTGGTFRLIHEDASKGMTAWTVGRYMAIHDIAENVRIRWADSGDSLIRSAIIMEAEFSKSLLKAVISLDQGSPKLRYDVECHWREVGNKDTGVPQLGFYLPLSYTVSQYAYDI